MRLAWRSWMAVSVFLSSPLPTEARRYLTLPVVHQLQGANAPRHSSEEFAVEHINDCAYISLDEMAGAMKGTLRWRPVARTVDLTARGSRISFGWDSSYVHVNDESIRLERPAIKRGSHLWVPISFFASQAFYDAVGGRVQWEEKREKTEDGRQKTEDGGLRTEDGRLKTEERGQKAEAAGARSEDRIVRTPAGIAVRRSPAVLSRPSSAAGKTPAVARRPAAPTEVRTPPRTALAPKPVTTVEPAAVSPATPTRSQSPSRRAIRRIVIDPGHGGKDPGTIGVRGTEEKAVNLRLSLELAEVLRNQFGYEIVLTRTDDTFVPLGQRARIANQAQADLFVSVHCNASLTNKLRGFEVYFLSETASDARADAVARAENAPLALEDTESRMPTKLKVLLHSLVRTANINDASALGALIDRRVGDRLKTPTLGVKQAAFYVLRGAEMPAVLVETGFLTNAKEERQLLDHRHRGRIVGGIAAAIDDFDRRKQRER